MYGLLIELVMGERGGGDRIHVHHAMFILGLVHALYIGSPVVFDPTCVVLYD